MFGQESDMVERQPLRQKSYKETLKVLEADIQHANTLASAFTEECDGARIQMRLLHSPFAQIFFFLVQWADCNLASTLGLLYILIYKVYPDGTTTMCTYERKASLREFYATIYPSLKQLHRGITDVEEQKQRASCQETYKKNANEEQRDVSDIDLEREEECGICLDTKTKVVLPNCNHAMCMDCYREWNARSESCPFCRDSLKRVNSTDLWVFTSSGEVIDMETLNRENLRRLFNYIDNLPLIVPETVFYVYDSHYDSYMK